MKRREFIAGLGIATAWPLAARAEQSPTIPVVGLLNGVSFASSASRVAAIRKGLMDAGYVEGRDVLIEYRSAEGEYDRLPELADDLVHRQVALIIAIGAIPAVFAAREKTTTIPIVFALGSDPVQLGLVPRLNRPGGNITGATSLNAELLPKRLEMLRELAPSVTDIGVLANPNNPNTELGVKQLRTLAQSGHWNLHVAAASRVSDLEPSFAAFVQTGVGAFLYITDALLATERNQMVALAARYALPAVYTSQEYAEAGGLMSYGTNDAELYLQAGVYAGRILGGENPADLPVQQSVRIQLIINMKTARALGLTVPEKLLVRADQVIE